jgi:cell wall-associated NlpC family hydrolase/uncharacterized membrane protein YgcG
VPERQAAVAALLERLLTDLEFRSAYRRDPAAAARAAGFGDLAPELALPARRALETLEVRESRQALAGVMMAAAVEGAAIMAFSEHVVPGLGALLPHVEEAQAATPRQGHAMADQRAAPAAAVEHAAPEPPDGEDDEPDEDEPDEDEPDEPDEPDDPGDEGPDVSDGDSGEDPDSHDDNSDAQATDQSSDSSGDGSSDSSGDGSSDSSGDGSSDSSGGGEADPGGSPLGGAAIDYPGDGAASEKLAAWMGGEARRRGLPPELPVMASLVESGMTNADHGDADSLGFFQMRASVWDSGPYAGYAGKPKLQLQWFLDSAERVKQDRQRRGLPMGEAHYGEWIADVERPAAQYRGRYQLRLEEARELLRKAGDGKGAGDGAELAAGVVDSASMTAGPHALAALTAAEHQLGVRYVWGGASPKTGFDCSGLVQWAYARAGIKLPRVTEEQILAPGGKAVSRGKLLPGDLVFFRNASGDVHHVGISLGGDRFIGAPHTGDVVKVASLREPSYAQEFAGGRRFDAAVRVAGRAAHARVLPTVNP